jgi:hypothetical protein
VLAEDESPEGILSQKIYRNGDLVIKPHAGWPYIDAVSVYRGKRRILQRSLRDYANVYSMMLWWVFPHSKKQFKIVRGFDGNFDALWSKDAKLEPNPFLNIDGDKIPDVMLAHDLGNAGESFEIYSLGAKPRRLISFNTLRSSADVQDVDKDGVSELLMSDTTFYGWKTCNACSPTPTVILKFSKNRLVLSTKTMRIPNPLSQYRNEIMRQWFEAERKENQNANGVQPTNPTEFRLAPAIWGSMLSLIYSGNSKAAFELLDAYWKNGRYAVNLESGKDCETVKTKKLRFENLFLHQLSFSPYLSGLKILNPTDTRIQRLKQRRTPGL